MWLTFSKSRIEKCKNGVVRPGLRPHEQIRLYGNRQCHYDSLQQKPSKLLINSTTKLVK